MKMNESIVFIFLLVLSASGCAGIQESTQVVLPKGSPKKSESTLVVLPITNTEDGTDQSIAFLRDADKSGMFKKTGIGDDAMQADFAVVGKWKVDWKPAGSKYIHNASEYINSHYEVNTTLVLQIIHNGVVADIVEFKNSPSITEVKSFNNSTDLLAPIYADLHRMYQVALSKIAEMQK